MTTRRNGFGQPIGEALPGWTPRPAPPRTPMQGRWSRLEPLDAGRHGEALHRAYEEAPDDRDWTYLPHDRERDQARFLAAVAERAKSADPLHFAVIRDGEALGSLAFMRIDPANGVIEIGHVHFAPRLQRSVAATEAVVLAMRRAFDLGYRRLEWKCDALNAPSRRAASRLGLRFEGVFRDAVITKGRSRDTAWYAATTADWPSLARSAEAWLSPDNFDADGHQRRDLETVRGGGA